MRIISRKRLREFWTKHPSARSPLTRWFEVVKYAYWENFADLRRTFSHADTVKVRSSNTVVVFNVGGNKLRVLAAVHYNTKTVYVLKVLTHRAYERTR